MNTSFIIITYQRNELLKKCLESLVSQITSTDQVIIIFNGEDTSGKDFSCQISNTLTFQINKTTPAAARNFALEYAEKEWVCFLDDDTILPSNYIEQAKNIIKEHKVDIFGGPDKVPPGSSPFENALSLALRSPLTTAHTRHRHKGTRKKGPGAESNLILCHLWIKKSWMKKIKFNPTLVRNEENHLLDLLHKKGANILYFPNLWIYHHRKKDITSLYHAVSTSGFYRSRTFAADPRLRNLIYFVPLAFNFYLTALILYPSIILSVPLLLYLFLNFFTTFREIIKSKQAALFGSVAFIQFIIIIFYGIGSLKGLIRVCISFIRGHGFGFERV